MRVTRFAPSPTGPLHLGHAYAAWTAQEVASGGRVLLRIEDIDRARCRPDWEAQIYDDLSWIGFAWEPPVLRQSERMAAYEAALARLGEKGLLYPCNCRRADIRAALSAPHGPAEVMGPDGLVYPGTCRGRTLDAAGPEDALRLDMACAVDWLGGATAIKALEIKEVGPIHEGVHRLDAAHLVDGIGDILLARRDMGTSYHLAVVVDDAFQGITHVTRGADLFAATPIHRLLQALLALPVPVWHHHDLVRDDQGKRLAKRDDARAIVAYRDAGVSVSELRAMSGLSPAS